MKIKKISFLPEFIPLIKSGKKTVTRRIKKKNLGVYYFTGGRTGKKEGYIQIIESKSVGLFESFYLYELPEKIPKNNFRYPITCIEAKKEGFISFPEFIDAWRRIHKNNLKYFWPINLMINTKEKTANPPDPQIFRIEFIYLGEEL